MKRLILNMFTVFTLVSCNPALAYDAVFVFSPNQSAEDAKAQVQDVLKFLTAQKHGYEALLVDGYALKTLGAYKNPESDIYKSQKARLNKNGAAVKALMDFAKNASLPINSNADDKYGALNIPQALRFTAENHRDNNPVEIVLIGSAIYANANDHAFSMAGGFIPSDGHLNVSRATSPYGTTDQPDLLKNARIHFLMPERESWKKDRYKFYLERFWSLYVDKLGGDLISFTHDEKSVFSALERKPNAVPHNYQLDPTPKLDMIYFSVGDGHSSIFKRTANQYFLQAKDIANVKNVMIAIRWDCMCDLDLYARPFRGAPILSFKKTSTPQGRHYREYVLSDEKELAYEIIAFDVPVDLSKLQILVHYFGGQTSDPVKGEIRLAAGGEVYAQEFYFEGKSGFSAEGIFEGFESGKANNKYIRLFDPVEMVVKQFLPPFIR